MTSEGLAPYLATTTPPTASVPDLSNTPRRVAGPRLTLAISPILIGTLLLTLITLSSMSSKLFT